MTLLEGFCHKKTCEEKIVLVKMASKSEPRKYMRGDKKEISKKKS